MPDNVQMSAPVGSGAQVRTLQDSGAVQWAVGTACYATTLASGANVLQPVMPGFPLPVTDAAAEAALAAILAKTPALGQALAAGSIPMVLTAAQLATLTPLLPAALSALGNLKASIAEINGIVASVNTGNADAGTIRTVLATNQPAVNVTETNLDGSIVAASGTVAFAKGVGVLGKTNDGTAQYQPVPLGPGGRTMIVEGFAGGVGFPVTGTFWQATQPVSVAALPALPLHQSVNVDQVGGTGLALGQQLAAASIPVVLTAAQLTTLTPVAGGSAVHTNATRNAGVLHRNAVTTSDKLATVGTITLTGQTTGSLGTGTTYYVSAAAFNRWGNALPASVVNVAPGAGNATLRCAFAAVAGADGYDIFLSTDVGAPKWVARITETQRASGCLVTAVGTVGAGGAVNSVDVQVVGTGLQTSVAPFTSNNALTPATPTAINCAGFSVAHLHIKMALTDLRSLPSLKLAPFFADQTSATDFFQGGPISPMLLTTSPACLEQDYQLPLDGATGLAVLVDTITGQGAAVSVWVELA